jgi:hypothetical protein
MSLANQNNIRFFHFSMFDSLYKGLLSEKYESYLKSEKKKTSDKDGEGDVEMADRSI